MHIYIYDTFLGEKKFARTLAQIEARITDLGLNGKIGRLGVMKKSYDLVRDEIKRGAKTIVAVGNDETVEKIARCMADTNVPLGIIPVGPKNNSIAEALGIGSEMDACDALSARRIESLDLGVIGNFHFLSEISTEENIVLNIDDGYSLELTRPGATIRIVNLAVGDVASLKDVNFNPKDGLLQVLIETKNKKNILFSENIFESVFPFRRAEFESRGEPIIFNGFLKTASHLEITVKNDALKVIVGKNRSF